MGAPSSRRLARRTTKTSVAVERGRLATKRHCGSIGSERGGGQSVAQTRARRRRRSPQSASAQRSHSEIVSRTEKANSRAISQRSRGVWVSRRCMDSEPSGRGHPPYVWSALSSRSRGQADARGRLEEASAHGASQSAQRRSHQAVVG